MHAIIKIIEQRDSDGYMLHGKENKISITYYPLGLEDVVSKLFRDQVNVIEREYKILSRYLPSDENKDENDGDIYEMRERHTELNRELGKLRSSMIEWNKGNGRIPGMSADCAFLPIEAKLIYVYEDSCSTYTFFYVMEFGIGEPMNISVYS
jgi:hypothetical protein